MVCVPKSTTATRLRDLGCWLYLFILMCWCSIQVKNRGITCLYMEAVDTKYMNFVSLEDYGSIMVIEYRILVYKCLLEMLEVDGTIQHVHISKKYITQSFPRCKIYELCNVLK
jgi:hypothetical protein